MRLLADNRVLTRKQPKTIMTATIAAAGTTLTVKSNLGFAQNDFVLIGNIGDEKAEIKQITAAVTAGTSLTIAAATFDQDIDTPITKIDFNQVRFNRGTTTVAADSTALAAAQAIDPSEIYSYYEDATNTTGYGFVRFYDAVGTTYSSYSDAIPYTGYTKQMLRWMRKRVRRLINEPDDKLIANEEIDEEINVAQQELAHLRLWKFSENTASFSSVANQWEYSLSSLCHRLFEATFDTQPLVVIDNQRFHILRWDAFTTGDPTHLAIWRNKARVYPYPSSSAGTTTLNGQISATATTITVVSTASFQTQGRIIIESEVISYTGTTSTTFTGCVRMEEETTAATHADTTTVTERDFIYIFQEDPNDLANETDETIFPDPNAIVYSAAAELALRKEDQTLHDRLIFKKEAAIKRLIETDQPKQLGKPLRVKDVAELVSDFGVIRDPNSYPQNLTD